LICGIYMFAFHPSPLVVIVIGEVLIHKNGTLRTWLCLSREEILDLERSNFVVPAYDSGFVVARRGHVGLMDSMVR
jgi:hypothetical protein